MVGSQTELRGRVAGSGSVRIDGRLEGEVDVAGDAFVGPEGVVVADIRARDVIIAGEVRGDVHAAGRLELLPTCRLYGDVHARRLAVADGAVVQGHLQVTEAADGPGPEAAAPSQPTAPPTAAPHAAPVEPAAGVLVDVQAVPVGVGGATAGAAVRPPDGFALSGSRDRPAWR